MLFVVFGLAVTSEVAAYFAIADRHVDLVAYLKWGMFFVSIFSLALLAVLLLDSIYYAKHYVSTVSSRIDVNHLISEMIFNAKPVYGMVVIAIMSVGIVSCANLNEIYRLTSSDWYDSFIWDFERSVFLWIKNFELSDFLFWDAIYLFLWPYTFICMAFLYRRSDAKMFCIMGLTVVLAFFITRAMNLALPTQGPVFFDPLFFETSESTSASLQHMLRLYMAGKILQNGLLPGTMGLPSLHVELCFLSMVFLRAAQPLSIWFTLPMFILTWCATVALGWHYITDGVIAMMVASASWRLADIIQR